MIANIGLLVVFVALNAFGLFKLKASNGEIGVDFAIGFLSYGAGFLIWYAILTRLPLSIAFPVAAGSLIVATQLVGRYFLGEHLNAVNFGGVALIAVGIVLIFSKA